MPTPRQHGGAALQPINLVSPAFKGLNTENEAALLGPEWATQLNNAIFDSAGRVSVRKGWNNQTGTPAASDIKQIFEYWKADGTNEVLMVSDTDIYSGLSVPTSVEGSATITNAMIQFANFNDKVIGFNGGLIVYSGTTFAAVSVGAGTAPDGTLGIAAYGRLWGVDADGVTIRYSALLDETDWSTASGGGVIDMALVWPRGQDTIKGMAAHNGDLVIFGEKTIVIWTDGGGSALGINPDNLYVADEIGGVGLVGVHAMETVKGDLWFLDENGVNSLGRVIQEKSNPFINLTTNNNSFVNELRRINEGTSDEITMTFSPREKMVLLCFPSANQTLYFSTLSPLQDGTYRMAKWNTDLQCAQFVKGDNLVYGALDSAIGEIFTYDGFTDNSANYEFSYKSGWLDFGPEVSQYLKMMKRIGSVVMVQNNSSVVYGWEFDFGRQAFSFPASVFGSAGAFFSSNAAEASEFGSNGVYDTSEATLVPGVNVSEFGGGLNLNVIPVPAKGTGQYIKVSVSLDTAGSGFAIQSLTLFAKIGRMA